jgi:hypothetical protein
MGIEETNKATAESMNQAVTLSSITWEILPNAGVVRMTATGSDARTYKVILPTNMHPGVLGS